MEYDIPASYTNAVSLCIMVLSAVIKVSSTKDHTSAEFPRALAELISLPFSELKYEVAILSIIKANLLQVFMKTKYLMLPFGSFSFSLRTSLTL